MNPLQKALCTKDEDTYCVLKAPSSNSTTTTVTNSTIANNAENFVAAGSDSDIIDGAIQSFEKNGAVTTSSNSLGRRATTTTSQTTLQYAPDTQVWGESGVMYLFTVPSLSAASLCTKCTGEILAAYAPWEANTPYGPGLSQSPMLGGQAELWSAASSKCGAAFVQTAQANVGPGVHPGVGSSLSGGLATVSLNLGGGFVALMAVSLSVLFAL